MDGSQIGLCFPIRRTAIREARRPRDGAWRSGEVGDGRGAMEERAWWGVAADTWLGLG